MTEASYTQDMTTKKHAQETEQPDTKEGEEPADEPIRDFEGEFAAAKYERDVAVVARLQGVRKRVDELTTKLGEPQDWRTEPTRAILDAPC